MFYKASLYHNLKLPNFDDHFATNNGMMFSYFATVRFYPYDFSEIYNLRVFVYCDLYYSFVIVLLYFSCFHYVCKIMR